MKRIQLSIVLPTYNEADNIIPLIKQILHFVKSYSFEIMVVDDDSPDGTAQKVEKYFGTNKEIKLFVKKKDKGLANAIRYGIEKTQGEFIMAMDTDFNHDPKEIPAMLSHKDSFDLVVGSRYIKGGGMENKYRYFLSLIYNLFIKQILRLSTRDNLSGFFLIKKGKLQQLPFDEIFLGYGDYFIRLLYFATRQKLNIKEIPVFYKNRLFGQSKSKFLSMFLDYSKTVLRLLLK